MTPVMLFARTSDDRQRSQVLREKSEAALREVEAIARRIEQMNAIYRERLEGRRRAQ